MRYASMLSILLLVGLSVAVLAEDRVVKAQNGQTVIMAPAVDVILGKAKATPQDMLFTKDTSSSVRQVCDAMDRTGLKTVAGIPCGDEQVRVIDKKVGQFEFKAIEYQGGVFGNRIAARSFNGTRLEELKLVLAGKIPYAEFGGHWMPSRTYHHEGADSPNTCFLYGLIGKNSKVQKVEENGDTIIYFVTQDGVCPYFAVETKKHFSVAHADERTFFADSSCEGFVYASVEDLRKQGAIPENATIGRTKYKTRTQVGEFELRSKTVEVKWTEPRVAIVTTLYPYYE